ncbi:meiotic recombination protein REC114 [Heliangelus exortis]|uniref:meiotic recombination protein REC114 n=1 Tax=Heliangelus exortis TaxID=472823 RepID=UPI003A8CFAA3
MAAAAAAAGAGGAGSGPGGASLLGSATTWPLKRYGRFLPPRESEGYGQNISSWKVFESNEESGHLTLTIVVSGHFFISQGRTVLEGFSLIDSHKWLKIVRRSESLLLCAQSKNECRMFRVQFGGDSEEQMQQHCCSCVQKLAEYAPIQMPDDQSQQLCHSLSQVANSDNQPDETVLDSCRSLGERRSVTQLAQSVLSRKFEPHLMYQQSVWRAQELGPFIQLCLMDQNFPAFVEEVEKELKKLTEG